MLVIVCQLRRAPRRDVNPRPLRADAPLNNRVFDTTLLMLRYIYIVFVLYDILYTHIYINSCVLEQLRPNVCR